jgi:copper ion binding protein
VGCRRAADTPAAAGEAARFDARFDFCRRRKYMTRTLTIEGMSCQHCVMRVKNALEELAGVKSAAVDLEKKTADVEMEQDVDESALSRAVQEAGYTVVSVY